MAKAKTVKFPVTPCHKDVMILHYPAGADEATKKAGCDVLKQIQEGRATDAMLPEGWTLTKPFAHLGQFTWDQQTRPPSRERRDDDPPYPAIRVHNSLTPVSKMGRPIRPVGDPAAQYPAWEVDIDGKTIVAHDPEEAWT